MKKQISKILLGLGTIGTVVAPIATTISCGNSENKHEIGVRQYIRQTIPEDFKWPEGVTKIDKYAFEWAILPKNFKIPKTVTFIDDCAFEGATFKGDFEIPNTITQIESAIFENAIFEGHITYNPSFDKLPTNLFWDCDFTDSKGITIGENVKIIGWDAFNDAILPSDFVLPNGIEEIGKGAFSGAHLSDTFTLPPSVSKIEWNAFNRWNFLQYDVDNNWKNRDDIYRKIVALNDESESGKTNQELIDYFIKNESATKDTFN